jgi:hypothetical protein
MTLLLPCSSSFVTRPYPTLDVPILPELAGFITKAPRLLKALQLRLVTLQAKQTRSEDLTENETTLLDGYLRCQRPFIVKIPYVLENAKYTHRLVENFIVGGHVRKPRGREPLFPYWIEVVDMNEKQKEEFDKFTPAQKLIFSRQLSRQDLLENEAFANRYRGRIALQVGFISAQAVP